MTTSSPPRDKDTPSVAMGDQNPIAGETVSSSEGGFIQQDNPIAEQNSNESESAPASAPVVKENPVVKFQDEEPEPSEEARADSNVATIALHERVLYKQLGIPYNEEDSVLCKAITGLENNKDNKALLSALEHLHGGLSVALGRPVEKTTTERKATTRWQELGQTVIAQKQASNLLQSLKQARKWEPAEGTLPHKIVTIVRQPNFQYAMTVNIICTGIVHGMVATSWAREDSGFEMALYVLDILLLTMSTVEFLAMTFTFSWRLLLDGWSFLDFFTITISWLVVMVGNPYWAFGVTRTFRLTRQFESSKLLVEGFVQAVPSILWVFLIIFINICVFTVVGVQFFREKSPEQYGNIRTGLYTSFKLMTLENWTDEAELLRTSYKYGTMYFILFITSNSFILLNLLIATVVDLIREIGQKKQEYREKKKLKDAGKHPTSSKTTNPFFKGLLPTVVKADKDGVGKLNTNLAAFLRTATKAERRKTVEKDETKLEMSVMSELNKNKTARASMALL